MSSFFAAVFPSRDAAQEAQALLERHAEAGLLRVASSVIIVKNDDGEITRHDGHSPGALGAGLGGIVGGIIGLIGGPAVGAMGAAAGAMSGGWFDLLREGDRNTFMQKVAQELTTCQSALLGEAIDPSDEAKRIVDADMNRLGGTLVGRAA